MRRLFLLMLLAATGSATVAAAGELPYGETLVFSIIRNGQTIGSHALSFKRQGGQLVVSTSIDVAVKMAGVTAYRYKHRGQETWIGDNFQSITTVTDDDGKKYKIRASQEDRGLIVEREMPDSVVRPSVNNQGLLRTEAVRETLPSGVLPSTHWNAKQIKQTQLLNPQNGTVEQIEVTLVGREKVKTVASTLEATRYTYSGGIRMDQWFDDRGRWVKLALVGSDGSTIEYVLQE
jgi:Family of unknown function (DUF6134)